MLKRLRRGPADERDELVAEPLRGELLGAEHLAERARSLARERRAGRGEGQRRAPLLGRLKRTLAILEDARARLGADGKADVGPAGEWLLDNYHVVQEHILEVRESLPRGYYRELPELTSGPLAGYPRVYEMAITLIAHSEGRIDLDNVDLFVGAFQQVTALSIGELWAIPAMLRLGLIENVRRMALRTVKRLDDMTAADEWAARIQAASENSGALNRAIGEFVARSEPLTAHFIARFLQQLRLSHGSFPPLLRLEQWIGEEGLGPEEAAARSNQRLAHTQLMMANSITSLRAISQRDWRGFVERQSRLEKVLREDPAGAYGRMTFEGRDSYRHVVERLAKGTGREQEAVAQQAIDLARAAEPAAGARRRSHVGFYLVDDGLDQLERSVGYRPGPLESIHRLVLAHPNLVFIGGILLGTLAVLLVLFRLAGVGLGLGWVPAILLALALIPANDIAVNLINQLVTTFLPPRTLPKLDLGEHGGIPADLRTAVVVPTLLGNLAAVRDAMENLETVYLSNRGPNLHFALLSDFTDASSERRDDDEAILTAAVEGVRALNARYAPETNDAFYLFHRPRRWNERQGVWMGWERKRGKLGEFNRFLRGGSQQAFCAIVGDVARLQDTRYVITLDADTVLPPETALLLVGTMAHPLNRASYDPERGQVIAGYGIIQPRVIVSLPSAHRSRFAAIHSGQPGVDPYTTAVSDVYQDLHGEGSYTGKGIYDVDAFEQATHGRFPENTLLSHDLIEGNYARAGLATDITLYDDYPTRYETFARRKHRWIRGDWQLLAWLRRWVPGPDGRERNRLSLLSRWKIVDNLRRSTVEIAQLVFLVAGWTVLPGSILRWTLLGLGLIAAPWLLSLLLALVRPPLDRSWRAYYAAVARDAMVSVQQVGLAVIFLPHQAWVSADAIVRTWWRLLVSRRRLLDWQTAGQVESSAPATASRTWRTMTPALVLVAAIALLVIAASRLHGPASLRAWQLLAVALPVLLTWALSPAVARDLGSPVIQPRPGPDPAQRAQALRYALLHWRFFDRFVTAETNWLAPDNYQDNPAPVVAMRTSPTNLGLQLLSTASAHQLGFISAETMTTRLERAFASMGRLQRFRGHLYNWYDLHDLRVLEPAYISTVDSGNLAGHLVALRQACLARIEEPLLDDRIGRGLDTALALALSALTAGPSPGKGPASPALKTAAGRVRQARAALAPLLGPASTIGQTLEALALVQQQVQAARDALGKADGQESTEWIDWSLDQIADHSQHLRALMATAPGTGPDVAAPASLRDLAARSPAAGALVERLQRLADQAYQQAMATDFSFLYDQERKLFSIGYQAASHARDGSFYDLLASEARLASFIAIAKGDVPVDHWFRLGRSLVHAGGATALVSWSGSMFEYLMPPLVMRSYRFTLLDQTHRSAIKRQISHAAERRVPWGVSESAYNLRDRHFTYQYRAFGVPGLALKRGLGRDLVVAPYAAMLAAMINPGRALANLAALERLGALGPYGFRDAIDYTRPDAGKRYAIVGNYMAHHIGMSLVAMTNLLQRGLWQRRFHLDPLVRSAELLLHERIPRAVVLHPAQRANPKEALPDPELDRSALRQVDTPFTPEPRIALLGHVPYTIMISQAGGGYSRYEELAVTRWRSDGTRDNTGQFCYLKDLSTGAVWSAAHQPVGAAADWFQSTLATDRVSFHRVDGEIETRTEVVAVPADAAEVRRVTVTNNSPEPREIELTSYGEIVLARPDSDRAHPAFANLFIETEYHEWCTAVTAIRRPRSAAEKPMWCVHVVATGNERQGAVTCETDRARFIGRGRSTRDPVALETSGPLSGTTGAVLDPIFALRTRIRLLPGQSSSVAFTTLVATTRERAFELADRYDDPHAAQRALDLAWTATQIELRELGITASDAAVFQDLAGHLLFSNRAMRVPEEEQRRNRGSQALLWSAGVSGDWPIVLAVIDAVEGRTTLRQLFAAHHYWRRRGMTVDLVIINAQPSSYLQELNDQIMESRFAAGDAALTDRPGGVFMRRRDQLRPEVLDMLRATARLLVPCDGRPLGRILATATRTGARGDDSDVPPTDEPPLRLPADGGERRLVLTPARGTPVKRPTPTRGTAALTGNATQATAAATPPGSDTALTLFNGFGGLAADGAYQIQVRGDRRPPAPWVNVVANERGGFLVSESGSGFTWAETSYAYRLTPWHNDPVSDPCSEAIYLRDDDSGQLWSATPAPIRRDVPFTIRHGAGFSSFEHEQAGIATRLTLGLAEEEPVKIGLCAVTNRSGRTRRLTITSYVEWTLGVLREHTQHQVHTRFDRQRGTIFAQNFFDAQFADCVAFHTLSEVTGHTGDRKEFLGRNGSVADPAALHQPALAGTTGPAIDPCAALQCQLTLAPGETRQLVILLGAARGAEEAERLVAAYRPLESARAAVGHNVERWRQRLSVITVRTPEPAFDAMINHWLLYQALACRIWARSALYQSSGAYGFRDQLQDVMSLLHAEPQLARAHILRAAARQFVEGDVQHWWHPQSGRGVRTRFSDDLAWLPYVVEHYVRVTGDATVLDEQVPFLTMRPLEPQEHEIYDLPQVSDERATVYEHCRRALARACTTGQHGLPLIGIGDWNDGMSRVGAEGKGESVWLAWFLVTTLRAFATVADRRGDSALAGDYRSRAQAYAAAVEQHGWDGEWYRRAYFDDGTPLGTAAADECRIDAIAQSWSVISGAGQPARQAQAMRSFEQHLVHNEARLLMLLTPPFDKAAVDPGYIKGYLPGVRENGAQYSHAALWSVLATARLGQRDRAFELYQMINPLTHAGTPEQVASYQVEPYVVAADVYTAKGHLGRGGWTWYTGSASWMYRVGLEEILGFSRQGNSLRIRPAVPTTWSSYAIVYRFGASSYDITVNPAPSGQASLPVVMDGRPLDQGIIPLVDDGKTHQVVVGTSIGADSASTS